MDTVLKSVLKAYGISSSEVTGTARHLAHEPLLLLLASIIGFVQAFLQIP